jgi:hypothetical protein
MRVFESRMLKDISALKREEVVGGWKVLHNEELSTMNFKMMKWRKRWAGHLTCWEEFIMPYNISDSRSQ